jgi:hypothetical protein
MYHVAAYKGSTHAQSSFDLTAIQDNILTIQNGHILPDVDMKLFMACGLAVDLTAMILVSPHLRQIVNPRVYPINASVTPPTRPQLVDRRLNPWIMKAVEEFQVQVNVGGAADETIFSILLIGDRLEMVPAGEVYSLHGSGTTAASSGAWTSEPIVWDQNLPAGTYIAISSQVQSTNAVAHRWTFKGQFLRPGFLSVTSLTNITFPEWYNGGMGAMGQFNTYTMPNLEVLCNAADAAHDVTLSCIKVA